MRPLRRALCNLCLIISQLAGVGMLVVGMFQRDMVLIVGGGLFALIHIAIEIREAITDE